LKLLTSEIDRLLAYSSVAAVARSEVFGWVVAKRGLEGTGLLCL